MENQTYNKYLNILKEELILATGCTEPVSLAYAAALGRELLGQFPERVEAHISGSIIKNVKSVVVPNTGGLKGIEAAIAAGIIEGDAQSGLEVLASVSRCAHENILEYLAQRCIHVHLAETEETFDINLELFAGTDKAQVRIAGHHTNVVLKEKNGEMIMQGQTTLEKLNETSVVDTFMSISEVYEFAISCELADVQPTIERQIECNSALSQAGMQEHWGVEIGRIMMERGNKDNVLLRAKARAAAGSDARMSGCELPAVINSGSGNQGITITMPIVEYAQALLVNHEYLIRAMVFANLTAVRIKKEIGCLSAYCGAVCAGCAAGAGIAFLHNADCSMVEHTIINGLAILSGTICDGAKPSCAAKIAMAVEAGVLGYEMARNGKEFVHGEGITKKGIENTIIKIGELGRIGMAETNTVVLNIMLED